jgi:histidinol-phosphate aminotransferase
MTVRTVHTRQALAQLPAYAPGRPVPGAVKLASNEMSFPPLPSVAAAIADAVSRGSAGINRYPDNAAVALTAALAEHVGAQPGNIAVGCGSVALCQQLVQTTCDDGDEVLFGWRSFEAYPIVTRVVGAAPVTVPVTGQHALDLPAMADAVGPRTRLIFICSPNNPTGTLVRAAELEAFLDAVPDDVLVVLDEAYREFVTDPGDGSVPDGTATALARPNVVSLRTMSKAYGLAGLRVGYAVGRPEVIRALQKVALPFAVNYLAQAAALASLSAGDELAVRCAAVAAERSRVLAALQSSGYEVPQSHANFVWLPLRERATDFAAHCEQHKVIVRPFADATGGVRVTVGAPEENDAFLAAAASWPGLAATAESTT